MTLEEVKKKMASVTCMGGDDSTICNTDRWAFSADDVAEVVKAATGTDRDKWKFVALVKLHNGKSGIFYERGEHGVRCQSGAESFDTERDSIRRGLDERGRAMIGIKVWG